MSVNLFNNLYETIWKKLKWNKNDKKQKYAIIGSLSVSVMIILIKYYKIIKNKELNKKLNSYYSHTYHDAKLKFINASKNIKNSKQHSLIIDTDKDLSIDLTFIPANNHGNSNELLIHISGTHGVEGYAGSAIQINVLNNVLPSIYTNENNSIPNILFVHGLNAFGMSEGRRWNRNNIDLNRNCILNKKTWDFVKNNNATYEPYIKFNDMINPKRKPNYYRDEIWLYFQMIYYVIRYGITNLRKAVVNGQYRDKNGLFYGGDELALEHDLLISYLQSNECHKKFGINLTQNITKLTMIDVHTGLGKKGIDTLMLLNDKDLKICKQLFPKYGKHRLSSFSTPGFMYNTYRDSRGYVVGFDGLSTIFNQCNNNDIIRIMQEFGTVGNLQIFKALRNENMAYQYCQNGDIKELKELYKQSLDVKRVFYCEYDPIWKQLILNSGTLVFLGLLLNKPH